MIRVLIVLLLLLATACTETRVVRVCADPNNLPFSNQAGEGFENRIAELLANDRGARLQYTWWAQRRGFVRNTLQAGACDVIIGVPTDFTLARTTRRYYQSSYVFVSRRDRQLHLRSLDDPRLAQFRIGVQMIGDDAANSPPAHALAARGILNVVGYSVYGDYSQPSPLSTIVAAVDRGTVDAAVVWGPAAAHGHRNVEHEGQRWPVGARRYRRHVQRVRCGSREIRRGDTQLAATLDDFIVRRRGDIDGILADYGVPRVEEE